MEPPELNDLRGNCDPGASSIPLGIHDLAEIFQPSFLVHRDILEEPIPALEGLKKLRIVPNDRLKVLDRLEVDYVKIDGSLIRGLSNSEAHKLQVKRIVDKAKSMNIGTIAESVQDASSLPIIWHCGVEFIQGYFLQEPAPAMGYDFSQLAF